MKRMFQVFIVLAALMAIALPSFSETKSELKNGFLVFYDNNGSTIEVVDVMAPCKKLFEFTNPQGVVTTVTGEINFTAVNSGTLVIQPNSTGGLARLTTGAADDDDAELTTELTWSPGNFCAMEARIRVNDPTCAFNVGFNDAVNEAADTLAFTYATTTLTTNASNAALFFADADATSNYIRCASVKANTDKTTTTTSTAFAEDAWHIYRVEIDSDGDISYWLDGVNVANQTAGITTSVNLCAYIGLINRSGAAQSLDVDKLIVWQSR